MELSAYLQRLRFDGSARPDLAALKSVHRAHQLAIPFENLDVLLRRLYLPALLSSDLNARSWLEFLSKSQTASAAVT